jgi:hypothetical protein
MEAYIFQAALLCSDCAATYMQQNVAPANPTGDSDEYPQGPYDDGGGESDIPQHCDYCACFLENPLTDDGRAYVQSELNKANVITGVLRDWQNYYGIKPYNLLDGVDNA